MTCDRSVVFSSFHHLWNRPPQYNWNIVGSGVKHHKPNSKPYLVSFYGHLFSERRTDSDIHQSPKPTTQTSVTDKTNTTRQAPKPDNSTRQMPKPDVKQSGTCCTM